MFTTRAYLPHHNTRFRCRHQPLENPGLKRGPFTGVIWSDFVRSISWDRIILFVADGFFWRNEISKKSSGRSTRQFPQIYLHRPLNGPWRSRNTQKATCPSRNLRLRQNQKIKIKCGSQMMTHSNQLNLLKSNAIIPFQIGSMNRKYGLNFVSRLHQAGFRRHTQRRNHEPRQPLWTRLED